MNGETEGRYKVWCVTTGGVTGHRESWLKNGGKVFSTNVRAEADYVRNECQDAVKTAHSRITYRVVDTANEAAVRA